MRTAARATGGSCRGRPCRCGTSMLRSYGRALSPRHRGSTAMCRSPPPPTYPQEPSLLQAQGAREAARPGAHANEPMPADALPPEALDKACNVSALCAEDVQWLAQGAREAFTQAANRFEREHG